MNKLTHNMNIQYNRMLILVIILIIFNSCFTMRYSTTGASISDDVKTFSVSYFQSRAPLATPTLGQDFTEKLKDKFLDQTNLQIIDGYGHLHFEGEITSYETKPMGIQANETAAQTRLSIRVHVKFVNEKDTDKNFEKDFDHYEDFSSDLSLEQVQDEYNETILGKIIEDIFNHAVVNW